MVSISKNSEMVSISKKSHSKCSDKLSNENENMNDSRIEFFKSEKSIVDLSLKLKQKQDHKYL